MTLINRSTDELKITRQIIWLLRVAVALQAIGVGFKYLFAEYETDSAIRSVLFYDWHWSEQLAQRIDDVGALGYFLCGVIVLIGPLICAILNVDVRRSFGWLAVEGTLLGCVAVAEMLLGLAKWHRDDEFMSSWSPFEQFPHFAIPLVIVGGAVRILLPVALIVLIRPKEDRCQSTKQLAVGMWILRIATAMTFAGHGIQCLYLDNVFVDYLLAGARNILGWDAAESTMQSMLRIIGVVDLLMASLILLQRWRFVPLYMAVWASIGAWSRVVHNGWIAHFEVTVRSANYCVPLAVYLYFRWCSSSEARRPPPADKPILLGKLGEDFSPTA